MRNRGPLSVLMDDAGACKLCDMPVMMLIFETISGAVMRALATEVNTAADATAAMILVKLHLERWMKLPFVGRDGV